MYSQDAIFNRNRNRNRNDNRSRSETITEVGSGLACVICGIDYRTAPTADPVVVSHRDDKQLLACRGVCAGEASGSTTGLDETPRPLADRIRGHETSRS
jgi:hypothetical protein